MTCLVESMWAADALGVVYTNNTGEVARIDKFEARNNDVAAQSLELHLVGPSQTADDSTIRLTQSIDPGDTDLCEALVGHDLEPGGAIYALASLASAVSIRVSGRYV